jgi:hypothetical protein
MITTNRKLMCHSPPGYDITLRYKLSYEAAHGYPIKERCELAPHESVPQPLRNVDKKSFHDERQLNLMVLCTHPNYRRRGAATLLVEWEQAAREAAVTLTLFANLEVVLFISN